jgi:hypothetical protein
MTLDKRLPSSESWTDRNKAGSLLQSITATRDPKAPAELRSEGLAPLIEMAQWYDTPHSVEHRIILGCIGGIEEAQLQKMALENDQMNIIIAAVRNAHKRETRVGQICETDL